MIAVADLSYRMFSGIKHIPVPELVFDGTPTALLLFAQIYGSKYHKNVQAARCEAKQELP